MIERITLAGFERRGDVLRLGYDLDGVSLVRTLRYSDVDFDDLAARYGRELLDRVSFHLLAMEAIPFLGLAPSELDLGDHGRFCTPAFEALWRTVARNVGAEWRYRTDRPGYEPRITGTRSAASARPVVVAAGANEALAFCGGGKDSLVALDLLERAGMRFGSFAYSQPEYGCAETQHRLIGEVLDEVPPAARHRMFVDDVPDRREVAGGAPLICAETPISLFAALPVVLQHGYRMMVFGHERGADSANIEWAGEQVNHQWGKSADAELLLDRYVREELLANVATFSILKPLHDAVIFGLLRARAAAVPRTHSCNVRKPWCERCPKCSYVWLGLRAYLPEPVVASMFARDLLDSENERHFRQLLGIESHRPFECVGDAGESRLAFELCLRRGLAGPVVDRVRAALPPADFSALLERSLHVAEPQPTMPPHVRARVLPLMQEAARTTRRFIEEL